MAREPAVCEWVTLEQALKAFVLNVSGHQSSGHIKPLHWYVASRLVIEGGSGRRISPPSRRFAFEPWVGGTIWNTRRSLEKAVSGPSWAA